MNAEPTTICERIRELRRRHFGPSGKAEFARRLALPPEAYDAYERGATPPGDVLVRICEVTGEDLQWLLTGVAARGALFIAGARGRHQALIARVARLLDENPGSAAPLEAFVDLLARGPAARLARPALSAPPPGESQPLIPILPIAALPESLPRDADDDSPEPARPPLPAPPLALERATRSPVALREPAAGSAAATEPAALVRCDAGGGATVEFVDAPLVARALPGVFGVRLADDAMTPLLRSDDVLLLAPEAPPRLGRPAVLRFRDGAARCRIWLGEVQARINLGRVRDGGIEQADAATVCWSLEVLYCLSAA